MPSPAVHLRFVGLLSSPRAEALARACISGLDAMYGDVERWEVCLHPPLAPWVSSGYAVRAQARRAGGGVISMRAQGSELEAAVRDAFDGIEELLLQEARGSAGRRPAWLPTRSGDSQALPA